MGGEEKVCNNLQNDLHNVGEVLGQVTGCNCVESEYYYEDYERLNEAVPPILEEMSVEKDTVALRSLYKLCDIRNRHNRTPMLTSRKFDILGALLKRIYREDCEGLDLALLLLNNLSIPFDNKIIIILGESSSEILDCLVRIMNKDIPEKVLACICLVNLSLIEESVKAIMYHAPIQDWCPDLSLLYNPESTIRILERDLRLKYKSTPVDLSIEKESLRWACNLAGNLCICEENANLLSLSEIPSLVLALLKKSTLPTSLWTADSIENSALRALCRFASWPILKIMLLEAEAPDVIREFTGRADIYDYESRQFLKCVGFDVEYALNDKEV